MYHTKSILFVRFVAMILVIALVVPVGASAATGETAQPYASAYLSSYSAYVYPAGNGLVQVYFSVTGTNYMDELGVLSIELYECTSSSEWKWVKTFKHTSTSGLLSYNDDYHGGHVNYQGVAGRYYKAYVCVWGGKNGSGNTRYFWTSSKKAT